MLSKPFVTSIIVGASTTNQLMMNLTAIDLELRPEELKVLNDLTKPVPIYPNWMQTMFPDSQAELALHGGTEPAQNTW